MVRSQEKCPIINWLLLSNINLILINELLVLCICNLDKYVCQRKWETGTLVTAHILGSILSWQISFDSKVEGPKETGRRRKQVIPGELPAAVCPSPVSQCAQVTRPALLVLGLLRLLLRSVASLPKAFLPRGTTVLIPRFVPWRTNGLSWLCVCFYVWVLQEPSGSYLVNAKTSSRRNSSTGKVKPGMWIIGHPSVDEAEGKFRWNQLLFCFLRFFSFFHDTSRGPTHQNTWRTSRRWAWHSSGWPWGRPGRRADPSRWWAKRQTAGFSRGSRPAPGGSRWTTIWRASDSSKEERKQLVRLQPGQIFCRE